MLYLNEWFPNPVGNDAKGEFVELFNASSSTVNLAGWSLWTGGKTKKFSLAGYSMQANGYLVLQKQQTKLSLKNTDGGLWLYGPGGKIVDQASFKGSAPIGESFSRIDYEMSAAGHFAFVSPTPGTQNKTINNQIAVRHYPLNVPLNAPLGIFPFIGLMFGLAITLIACFAYILHKNENLSNLIFKGDTASR